MNTNIVRLLSTLIVPVALVAGVVGCQEGKAKGAAIALAPALDRDAPIVPKNHPELTFYSARTQGEEQTKVFVHGKAGETVVYVDAEPGELIRVSDDGMHGVYRRFISPGVTADIAVDFQKSES